MIFDVKRYAIHDGPGIRLTLFFKGCSLGCEWCHNPESKSPRVQKLYTAKKCIGAVECVEICPNDALTLTPNGIETDPNACELCGKCADVCPTKAIEMSGTVYSTDQIVDLIEKERVFFDQSNGGVTFSGGEPLTHAEFLIPVLKKCGDKDIHRVVDTSGHVPANTILEVAKHTDLFLYDLKHMDPVKHKQSTGAENSKILRNLELLAESGATIVIRVPVIPGFNMDEDNMHKTALFISELAGEPKSVNLLPYHNIVQPKYDKLGLLNPAGKKFREPTQEELSHIVDIYQSYNLTVSVGG